MDAVFYIMVYLGLHHNLNICMGLAYPDNESQWIPKMDWKEFYDSVQKPIPTNTPKSLDNPVDV